MNEPQSASTGVGTGSTWPANAAILTDTTCCPSCFTMLRSARCGGCGLDLAVPAAHDLLAASQRMQANAAERERVIAGMRYAQAQRKTLAADSHPTVEHPNAPHAPPAPPRARVARQTPLSDAPHDQHAKIPTAATPAAPRHSGVQVLLLTLGVILLAVAAVVFLFVAYLIASLETRSLITVGASAIVIVIAWLLRRRGLASTSEGISAVAIVLIVLDIWIIRANGLFGSDQINGFTFWGASLLVAAAVFAALSTQTGLRTPMISSAVLAPVGLALVVGGVSIDAAPSERTWLGGAAVLLASAVAVRIARPLERVIVAISGVVGGTLAFIGAFTLTGDLTWHPSLILGITAAAWLCLGATHRVSVRGSQFVIAFASAGFGASLTSAATFGVFIEFDPATSFWASPLVGGLVLALLAVPTRLRARVAHDMRGARYAAAGVLALASCAPLVVAVSDIFVSTVLGPTLSARTDATLWLLPGENSLSAGLGMLAVAASATFALWAGRSFVRYGSIPLAVAAVGASALAASLPGDALFAGTLVLFAAVSLAAARFSRLRAVVGARTVLACFGLISSTRALVFVTQSQIDWLWWSVLVSVLVLAGAGRVFAERIWPIAIARALAPAHIVMGVTLLIYAAANVGTRLSLSLSDEWTGGIAPVVVASAAVLLAALSPLARSRSDQMALTIPALSIGTLTAVWVSLGSTEALVWIAPTVLAAASVIWAVLPRAHPAALFAAAAPITIAAAMHAIVASGAPDMIALSLAIAALAGAAATPVLPRRDHVRRTAWTISVVMVASIALAWGLGTNEQSSALWLILTLLAPIPVLVIAIDGDPVRSSSRTRHSAWVSLALAVASIWAWLADGGTTDIEAYTVPLATALLLAGSLIVWRRPLHSPELVALGRTTILGSAAAVAVLPSIALSGASDLRTLILVCGGAVLAVSAAFVGARVRGLPLRALVLTTGWVAASGAALVHGLHASQALAKIVDVELWSVLALFIGVLAAVILTRTPERESRFAETVLISTIVAATAPTGFAIMCEHAPVIRASLLLAGLAIAAVASAAALTRRPWSNSSVRVSILSILAGWAALMLASGTVEPFDIVTVPVAVALLASGGLQMRRQRGLGSWRALGAGLAVLLLPALIADWTEPTLWRVVALGVVVVVVVAVGAVHRLQAPLLLGSVVLLIHTVAQLWPWIAMMYEAVWWWLWLGIAGVILIVLAATYERQLQVARRTVGALSTLR